MILSTFSTIVKICCYIKYYQIQFSNLYELISCLKYNSVVYICITVEDPEREDWDYINQFNPATFLCLSQTRTWISNGIGHGLFYVQWLRWKVIVCLVDIGGTVDHHCLNYVFIILSLCYNSSQCNAWFFNDCYW